MKKLIVAIGILLLTLAGCGRGYYARGGYGRPYHHHHDHGYYDRGYARY